MPACYTVLPYEVGLRLAHTTRGSVYEGVCMDLFEAHTQSFVIKIWLEETAEEGDQVIWRGHITQVPSGERLYLKDLDDILTFIAPFLEKMDVRLGIRWRLRNWLRRLRA